MTESTGDGLQIMTNKQPYETCLFGPRNAGLAQDAVTLSVSGETGMTPLIITSLQVQPLQALSEIMETRAPHAEPGPRRRESCYSSKRCPSGTLAYLFFPGKSLKTDLFCIPPSPSADRRFPSSATPQCWALTPPQVRGPPMEHNNYFKGLLRIPF